MTNLHTYFAGLSLKNPIIVASSNRTNNAKENKLLEDSGAAAIVLKSIFEESITRQTASLSDQTMHGEGADYLQGYLRSQVLNEYVTLVRESKQLCTIPIIASINCSSLGEWSHFAALLEEAGADAIELNIMTICAKVDYKDGAFEMEHIRIVEAIRKVVKVPIIVKLGSYLTNYVNLINRLMAAGASGIVLFNRMYQTSINVEHMEFVPKNILSVKSDLATPLRWVGIASAAVKRIDYALSGGVHTGEDIVKAILVGSSAVEVCSALYKNGNGWIKEALACVEDWQNRKGYETIEKYKGLMNAASEESAEQLQRNQFLKYVESYNG
ncbi:MAG: dihydroorotate dehydrogenase-like protein [Phocaeicola sp.]